MADSRKHWRETMTPDEAAWIDGQFNKLLGSGRFCCADNFRAARTWKSGFFDAVVGRWNWRRLEYDLHLIGFNYGH